MLGILLSGIGSREKTVVELAGEVIGEADGLHGLYDVSMQVPEYQNSCSPFQRLAGREHSQGGAGVMCSETPGSLVSECQQPRDLTCALTEGVAKLPYAL